MIDAKLLAAVDDELSALLEAYLVELVTDSLSGGGSGQCSKGDIGNWVLTRLGYPLSCPKPEWPTKSNGSAPKPKRDYRHIVFERDGFKCVKCPSVENLTVDHIVPISKGGKTEMSNLQTLCKTCNSKKGNR